MVHNKKKISKKKCLSTLRLTRCLRSASINYSIRQDDVIIQNVLPQNFIIRGDGTYYTVILLPSLIAVNLFCNYSPAILFAKMRSKGFLSEYQYNTIKDFC